MGKLTDAEIQALNATVKQYPFLVSAGADKLGPLNGAPSIEADTATKPVTLYETGEEVQGELVTKNNVKLTLKTRNVDKAMELLATVKKGDNIYATDKKKSVTLVPITDAAGAQTITFPNAYLQPGLSYTPGDGDPHEAQLVYVCKPDSATGIPWEYGNAEA